MTDEADLAWLRAQMDEDERPAREALDVDARTFTPPEFTVEYQWARMTRHTSGGSGHGFAAGAPSPARVLAEVQAKRKMVSHIVDVFPQTAQVYDGVEWVPHAEVMLRLLALPYAARPGCPERWRVMTS